MKNHLPLANKISRNSKPSEIIDLVKTRVGKTHGRVEKNSKMTRITELMAEASSKVNKSRLVLLDQKDIDNSIHKMEVAATMFFEEIKVMKEQLQVIIERKKELLDEEYNQMRKEEKKTLENLRTAAEKIWKEETPICDEFEKQENEREERKEEVKVLNEILIQNFNNKIDSLTSEELKDTLVLKDMFEDDSDSEDEITRENIKNQIEG